MAMNLNHVLAQAVGPLAQAVGPWAYLNVQGPKAPTAPAAAEKDIGSTLATMKDPAAQLLALKQYAADQVMGDPEQSKHFLKHYVAQLDRLMQRDEVRAQLDPQLVTILTDPNPSEARQNQAGMIKGDMKGLVIADPKITAQGKSWAAANNVTWNAKAATQFMSTLSPGEAKAARQVTLSDDDIKNLPLEVREHLTLDDAVLYHPLFHPATTDLPNTTQAEMFHAVFRDLGDDKVINLSEGLYHGASFENVTDVTIRIGIDENGKNQLTRIEDFNISGVHATIEMGSMATIDRMEVDERTRILKFDMQPGATVSNAYISEATISMASELQGTNWNNVTFAGTSFSGVDLHGASFANAVFEGAELNAADFSGATFKGSLSIDGKQFDNEKEIQQELVRQGAIVDPQNPVKLVAHAASVEQRETRQEARIEAPAIEPDRLAAVGETIALRDGGSTMGDAIARAENYVANNRPQYTPITPVRINGGQDVDFDQISPGAAVAKLDFKKEVSQDFDPSYFSRMSDQGGRPS